jgi:sugar phosphate isomerase/epimerase
MEWSRREVLGSVVGSVGAVAAGALPSAASVSQPKARQRSAAEPFGYCLNTSTIRGNQLGIVREVEAIGKAGFDAIEPWITEIDTYTKDGGTLKDLGRRISDGGLTVANAIAFNAFLNDDPAQRAAGMEALKTDMDKVAQIGGARIAVPPGRGPAVNLDNAAKYYREALELGEKMGVHPLCELWGTHPVLGPLRNGIYVTVAAGRPDASLLLDVFHIYKSGTQFISLRQINGGALHVIHINDYPQAADSSTLNDSNRVYPGDGVAPFPQILRDMRDNGFRGYFSLELFNKDYWAKPAEENLKTGLEKMRAVVKQALA